MADEAVEDAERPRRAIRQLGIGVRGRVEGVVGAVARHREEADGRRVAAEALDARQPVLEEDVRRWRPLVVHVQGRADAVQPAGLRGDVGVAEAASRAGNAERILDDASVHGRRAVADGRCRAEARREGRVAATGDADGVHAEVRQRAVARVQHLRLAVVAVAVEDRIAGEPLRREHDAAAFSSGAEDEVEVVRVRAFVFREVRADLECRAVEVLAQDDVDDAAEGVGAVDGRGAVREHLDAFDGGERNGVEIHRGGAGERIARHAAPVDENRRAIRAEPAQIHQRDLAEAAAGAFAEGAEGVVGGVAQQIGNVLQAGELDLRPVEDRDRIRRVGDLAADARAGDDHRLDFRCALGLLRRSRQRQPPQGPSGCHCPNCVRQARAFEHLVLPKRVRLVSAL